MIPLEWTGLLDLLAGFSMETLWCKLVAPVWLVLHTQLMVKKEQGLHYIAQGRAKAKVRHCHWSQELTVRGCKKECDVGIWEMTRWGNRRWKVLTILFDYNGSHIIKDTQGQFALEVK